MTPSIIRRFAKYHGIDVTAVAMAPTAPWGGIANLASAIYGSCHTEHVAKVIQTITRIEDAEMLAWSMAQDKPRVVQNALDLERCALLLRAGIDPEKWREEKE